MLILELFLVAIAHIYTFPTKDFKLKPDGGQEDVSCWGNFLNMIDVRDLATDLTYVVQGQAVVPNAAAGKAGAAGGGASRPEPAAAARGGQLHPAKVEDIELGVYDGAGADAERPSSSQQGAGPPHAKPRSSVSRRLFHGDDRAPSPEARGMEAGLPRASPGSPMPDFESRGLVAGMRRSDRGSGPASPASGALLSRRVSAPVPAGTSYDDSDSALEVAWRSGAIVSGSLLPLRRSRRADDGRNPGDDAPAHVDDGPRRHPKKGPGGERAPRSSAASVAVEKVAAPKVCIGPCLSGLRETDFMGEKGRPTRPCLNLLHPKYVY